MLTNGGPEMKEPKAMREIHKIREELHKEWKMMSRKDVIRSVNRSGRDFERRRASIKPLAYKIPPDLSGRVRDILEPKAMEEIHEIREKLKRKKG